MDPYAILDVPKDASSEVIRESYKRLAKLYHPDKNSEPGAEDKFKEIANAYKILSSQEEIIIYLLDVEYHDLILGASRWIKHLDIEVNIPRASWPGRIINVYGKILKLQPESKNKHIRHKKYDLIYTYQMTVFDALLGCTKDVKIIDKTYSMNHPNPITPGSYIVFENGGLYTKDGDRGKLIIKFDIVFPTELTHEQRMFIERC